MDRRVIKVPSLLKEELHEIIKIAVCKTEFTED